MTETAPAASLRRMAGRAGWALGDQALASLINFAVGVIVARSVDPEGFGAFTLAFSTYLIVLNVARAIAMQPLVIRYSTMTVDHWGRAVASASGTLVVVGIVAAVPIALVGAFLSAPLGPALLALGLALVPLLVQDGWRPALFAAGRARSAFAVDLLNVAVVIPVIWLGSALPLAQPAGAIVMWGLSSVPSSILGARLTGARPLPSRASAWVSEHRDLAPRLAAETSVALGAAQGTIYAVGAVAGLAAAGSIRGAQLLLGPLHVLVQAAYLFALPEGARVWASHPERFVPAMAAVSLALALATLGFLGVLLALPDTVGQQLLGPSWEPARSVLLPLGLALTGQSLAAGPIAGLRIVADARSSLRVVLIQAPVGLALGVGGAFVGGAPGAAWGFAVGSAVGFALSLVAFAWSTARHAHPNAAG